MSLFPGLFVNTVKTATHISGDDFCKQYKSEHIVACNIVKVRVHLLRLAKNLRQLFSARLIKRTPSKGQRMSQILFSNV